MPSKKKKYNARFPPARIKKIMQTDEEVGKVAAAVPVIISRALELFIDSLIEKTASVTRGKNAKTLSSSHVKQAIHSEKTFDFLRDLVQNVPDHQTEEEMDLQAPSGSGVVEKKPKIPRPRKPKEEGGSSRGRGRPRKVKVKEKKESESEESNEETETDEEQTADEDPQPLQPNPAHGECSTQYLPQGQCNSQIMDHSQPEVQATSNDHTQDSSQGQCRNSEGLTKETVHKIHSNKDSKAEVMSMQQESHPESAAGMSRIQSSPVPPGHTPPQSEDQSQSAQVISSVQGELTSNKHSAQALSQQNVQVSQQFPHPGFPGHNMMFPQYPYMGAGQPLPFLHPQSPLGSVPPSSTASGNPALHSPGSVPPQFIPGHPAFMMPPMGQNGPMLPMGLGMPGMPMGPPPPLIPISNAKNTQDNDVDSNVPLDMSLAGKSRSQTTTVPSSSASLSQPPTPHGMPALPRFNMQPEMHPLPHPQAFPQWRMDSQINQNFQETGFRPQITGPPPLISSSETQSPVTLKENGRHKQSDGKTESVTKKAKQRNASGNPSEQKSVSFPGLANLMNMKPVKSSQNDVDDDYDS